jgi:AcrR family transcriptional regulator
LPGQKEKPSPRDRLLDTAGRLFQRHGFQAVGIDRILAESGVAKMTLYRYFPSKDEMIAAYLERADAQFWGWANAAMRDAKTPEAKLLALFDALGKLASNPECLGCVFQAAATAFPEVDHPGHKVAVQHKLSVRTYLADLAQQANLRDSQALAAQLALLMDGAWISARLFPIGDNPAVTVAAAARALIEARRRVRSRTSAKKRR